MGFLWNKNKYDICPAEKDLKTLITNYLRGASIKINSKVVVPDGYWCVLGKRGKVADKFDTGEHFLTFASMPYMCRRFGIDKIKDGKQKDKIECDCYFVDKALRAGQFKTYRKVEMGTKAYGIYKMHVFGMYSYKVSNVQELMQSLLNEYDYIKTGEAEDIIEAWVNEVVVATLEKKNFVISDVVQNSPIIAEALKTAVSKLFSTAGLELCELKIYKYKLPKKYQEESDRIIAEQTAKEQQLLNGEQYAQDDSPTEQIQLNIETGAQVSIDKQTAEQQGQVNAKEQDAQTELYNNADMQKAEIAKLENLHTDEQVEYVPFGNFKIDKGSLNVQTFEQKTEKTFVDLNLDNLYADKKPNIKRCLNCGAENNKNADHCLLCGEKFIEEDI